MSMTLDRLFIPACQQMLGSVSSILEKAHIHAEENGISESDILSARLAETMWPLPYQVHSMWVHTDYVIDQVKAGEFRPNVQDIPTNWSQMHSKLDKAKLKLKTLADGELDAIANQEMYFVIGNKRMFEFTVQNFLLSFTIPNIYFHATTAYDVLRMKGVELGKFDYLGIMRNEQIQ